MPLLPALGVRLVFAAEVADANLYAANVRNTMAAASGRPVFAHSVFDKLMYSEAFARQVRAYLSRQTLLVHKGVGHVGWG